jgi:hypothetical protein
MNFKNLKPATRAALRDGAAKLRALQTQAESGPLPALKPGHKNNASRALHAAVRVGLRPKR